MLLTLGRHCILYSKLSHDKNNVIELENVLIYPMFLSAGYVYRRVWALARSRGLRICPKRRELPLARCSLVHRVRPERRNLPLARRAEFAWNAAKTAGTVQLITNMSLNPNARNIKIFLT